MEEGRGVFDHLTKFITWTLPTNTGEGLVILVAIALGTAAIAQRDVVRSAAATAPTAPHVRGTVRRSLRRTSLIPCSLPAERQLRRLARFVDAAGGPDVPVALHVAEGPRAAAVDRLAHAASEPPAPSTS